MASEEPSGEGNVPEPAHDAAPPPNGGVDEPEAASHDGASGPSSPVADASSEASESSGGGGDEASEDDGGAEAEAEGGPHAEGESGAEAANGEKPKKKRKRRRKKKKAGGEGESKEATEAAKPDKPHRHRHPTERAPFQVGEEVFGKVTSVLDAAIMVDLSGKALAIFDRSEMAADDLVPTAGDRFLGRVHQDGGRGGLVVLTRKPLREEETKPLVEKAMHEGTLIQGLVTGVIKGGVEVDIQGLRAFAPASGMDLHPHNANFVELIGQLMEFKVVQFESGGRDVVVTRRPMLEAEAHERRKKALELLSEEQVLPGVVRTVVDWGLFVALPDAENLEGLVHAVEATHDPRARLADLFRPGDKLDVKILKIDEKGKIWLSRKALVSDPWVDTTNANPLGTKLTGKVTTVEKFGVFVQIAEGIEGLIHISDLSLKRIEHPSELVKPGDSIDVVIHGYDDRNRKITLHPALSGAQAEEAPQKPTKSQIVKVEVIRGESAGVVVRLLGVTGRAARGFIPAGHTGTQRGTDLRKKFPPGTKLDAKIIEVDPRRGEPKLSIRVAAEDEERRAHKEYRQQLAREGGFGTLGDLFAGKLK
jgi:small subunit ribosomal protein S1